MQMEDQLQTMQILLLVFLLLVACQQQGKAV